MAKASNALAEPMILVVMGVSGCGKTTVGQALAHHLGCEFAEGDQFHPPQNVAKMAAGTPLDDNDRWGWLQTLSARMAQARSAGQSLVLSCSALRKPYRDILRAGAPQAWFVHLHGDTAVLRQRMASRPAHYMPPSLLQSQLDTLEMPEADERVVSLDIATPLPEMVSRVMSSVR